MNGRISLVRVQYKNASSAKTRERIVRTFITLLSEKKDMSHITVSELVRRANINRTTFYIHYDNIQQVGDEIVTDITDAFLDDPCNHSLNDYTELLETLLQYLTENEMILSMLSQSDHALSLSLRITSSCRRVILQALETDSHTPVDKSVITAVSILCDGLAVQFWEYYRGNLDIQLHDLIRIGQQQLDCIIDEYRKDRR